MRRKRLIFSTHAQNRLKIRKITQLQVRETVERPTSKSSIKADNSQEFRKRFGAKTLIVQIGISSKTDYIVITEWWKDE